MTISHKHWVIPFNPPFLHTSTPPLYIITSIFLPIISFPIIENSCCVFLDLFLCLLGIEIRNSDDDGLRILDVLNVNEIQFIVKLTLVCIGNDYFRRVEWIRVGTARVDLDFSVVGMFFNSVHMLLVFRKVERKVFFECQFGLKEL